LPLLLGFRWPSPSALADGIREAWKKEASPDFEGDDHQEDEPAVALPARPRNKGPAAGDKPQPAERVGEGGVESSGDKAPHGERAEAGAEDEKEGQPWVPERVKKALAKSGTFDEFRKNRPFRYLHMFSGETDQLGISIRAEASKARLEVYLESLDRKKDAELDLTSPALYDEIEKSVLEGEWDGYHSGFPCASFSRVRWRDSPGGKLPVRSADHIYGLPGNTPSQQREADEGTLMATRSREAGEDIQALSRARSVCLLLYDECKARRSAFRETLMYFFQGEDFDEAFGHVSVHFNRGLFLLRLYRLIVFQRSELSHVHFGAQGLVCHAGKDV